jgi:hypothetical protein
MARRATAEAIQNQDRGLDCFVAEPVIGPRIARTRWRLAIAMLIGS